ncbi:penicillin-insensitive murein endopeptidase [Nannocystis sp. SCPEA4]|uniref:penicillin-insensitive murein endopeptidase n=1 Tax=Nannocystis sp. SCPEA4 TaxID=2996787 RepID=UPI00226F3D0A|nr:penicillin-insensitive murein endopeptidase [Nannocystis sp. SCPEA4]MCY1060177.1 penicillin-insensitive murein endopeptidase [Nannocystis sp. SCPEA4]
MAAPRIVPRARRRAAASDTTGGATSPRIPPLRTSSRRWRRVRLGLAFLLFCVLLRGVVRPLVPELGSRSPRLARTKHARAAAGSTRPPEPDRRHLGEPTPPRLAEAWQPLGLYDDIDFGARVVRLPLSDDYDLRCPINAHASGFTAENLRLAIARLRAVYPGQLVIGDISRPNGGPFGAHRSHQSGRDVDIWLPIIGGLYRTAPECSSCGTDWCRPAPDDVDWRVAWSLIRALAHTGAVAHVFLDRSLHPRLRAAALASGAEPQEVDRAIQPRPGAPALIMHSAGHTRHIHVRFICGPDEPACED